MIRLIKFLITGDWHLCQWEKEGDRVDYFELPYSKMRRQVRQPMRCSRCGKMKSFKL